ncbi:MAG: hypothetical protein IKJ00_02610 [Clostridia bacterium]|nr:hypothetical protein [Clostridia bacterium]
MKEKVTLDNIKEDLEKIVGLKSYRTSEWRISFILPFMLIGLIVTFYFKYRWIVMAFFVGAIYHAFQLSRESKQNEKKRRELADAVGRGDFSISKQTLSHIATETIYEPNQSGSHGRVSKDIKCFYFLSGISWRVPEVDVHYGWSKEFYMTSSGLDNTSVKGNEFYFVTLKGHHDISYIYNTNMFYVEENTVSDEAVNEEKEEII